MDPNTIAQEKWTGTSEKEYGRTNINDCSIRDESYLILGTTTRIMHQLGSDSMSEANKNITTFTNAPSPGLECKLGVTCNLRIHCARNSRLMEFQFLVRT